MLSVLDIFRGSYSLNWATTFCVFSCINPCIHWICSLLASWEDCSWECWWNINPRDQMWTPTSICLHLFKQSWEKTQWIWVLWITTSSNRPHFAIISPFYENSQTQLSHSSVSSWILCNFKTELNGLWSHNPLNRLPICKRISAKV